MHLEQRCEEIAEKHNETSFVTHMPKGGVLVYVGPDELDVIGTMMRAALQIEEHRAKKLAGISRDES